MTNSLDTVTPYHRDRIATSIAGALSLSLALTVPVRAQIVPDSTLPNNSIVTPDSNRVTLDGGTTAGSNLFHSFREFSIPTGSEAFFNNATTIDNIITRITGGDSSHIDGLIRANGNANLFLINPNGIVFGPNARLDIGGSFIGSTANSIQLSDGSFFSATNPEAPPLLTVNVPIGLQMGADPGKIEVIGAGRQLVVDSLTGQLDDTDPLSGLQVSPGRTLALVGGNVTLAGGNLFAKDGRVEIGSVSGGTVTLNPMNSDFAFEYQGIADFQDITLNRSGAIANPGGRVQLQGRRIQILDGAQIVANARQNAIAPGKIRIQASELVHVSGTAEAIPSGLFAFVESESTGEGGDISIETNSLQVTDGAFINTDTLGAGNGGNISIRADRVRVSSNPEILDLTGIFASVLGDATGDGGNISIEADRLQVTDGGLIDTSTLGRGNGGNISIRANRVEISSNPEIPFFTGVFASILGTAEGNGGAVTVEAERLRVTNGGQIGVTTFASGSGGNILIRAAEMEVFGNPDNPILTAVIAGVEPGSAGDGGNIAIEADRLQVANRGVITTDTFSVGDGGTIAIRANQVDVLGTLDREAFTGIFSSVLGTATGNGGNVTVEAERLRAIDDGQIASSVFGAGNGGNVTIRASEVEIGSATARIYTSGIFGSVLTRASGNGGNVSVEADRLRVVGGGLLSVRTFGDGNAGNLMVRAAEIELAGTTRDGLAVSSISASSTSDFAAGSIAIDAERLSIRDRAEIAVSGFSAGDAGNLIVAADSIVANNDSQIAAVTSSGEGGNISLQVQDLELQRGSKITAEAEGMGNGGNITLNTETIALLENSSITANAFEGNGGKIAIATQGLLVSPNSTITASSQFGVAGTVSVISPDVDPSSGLRELPQEAIDPSEQIVTGCAAAEGNYFAITGRGGLPEDPTVTLRGSTVWRDWQDYSKPTARSNGQQQDSRRSAIGEVRNARIDVSRTLVEANGWIVHPDGRIELVAIADNVQKQQLSLNCAAKQFVHPAVNGAKLQQPIP